VLRRPNINPLSRLSEITSPIKQIDGYELLDPAATKTKDPAPKIKQRNSERQKESES
jgi:hypothetical protein